MNYVHEFIFETTEVTKDYTLDTDWWDESEGISKDTNIYAK